MAGWRLLSLGGGRGACNYVNSISVGVCKGQSAVSDIDSPVKKRDVWPRRFVGVWRCVSSVRGGAGEIGVKNTVTPVIWICSNKELVTGPS